MTKTIQDIVILRNFLFLFLDVTELINRVPNPASDEVVWDFRAYAKIWPDLTNCNSHDESHWLSHVDIH